MAWRAAALARVGVLSIASAGACSEKASLATHSDSTSELKIPSALLSARRPDVEFYMQKIGDRCEIYWQRGEERSKGQDEACLFDMVLGERLHIVGMVCMRESPEPSRVMPVVCPDSLTNLEKEYRKSAAAAAAAGSTAAPSARPSNP